MKRVFIIHCWGARPKDHWYPWLKKELEQRGFSVYIPTMPDTETPTIAKWTGVLAKKVENVDENTYFVGHSIGCQTIIRYLMEQNKRCGGAIFVAGWFTLTGLETTMEKSIAKPWLYEPINFEKAKKNIRISVAILGDDDPHVFLKTNAEVFRKILGAKVIIEKGKGHFDDEGEERKPLSALKELITMAR
jgi:predicted alpha/beta hydrolase family esterase